MHEYINYLFVENILVTIIVIFVILYIFFNMDIIGSGNYFGGYLSQPIIYTCIIILIGLVIVECDKKDDKVNNNAVVMDTLSEKTGGNEKKYKIVNKDIFISNKDKYMFGLKM
jgi:hypothetical protein